MQNTSMVLKKAIKMKENLLIIKKGGFDPNSRAQILFHIGIIVYRHRYVGTNFITQGAKAITQVDMIKSIHIHSISSRGQKLFFYLRIR